MLNSRLHLTESELGQTLLALENYGGSRREIRALENKVERGERLYPAEKQTVIAALQQRAQQQANTANAADTGAALDKILARFADDTGGRTSSAALEALFQSKAQTATNAPAAPAESSAPAAPAAN